MQARVPSKFARYFEPEEQIALFRSEVRWNKEEDAALIGRKSIPQIRLTRAQSAHRKELVGRLGGGTQSGKVRADSVTNLFHTHCCNGSCRTESDLHAAGEADPAGRGDELPAREGPT